MRVFISYPREFQEFAEQIEAELQNRHFDTFLDRHKMNPSQAWTVEIERQIKRSKVFVILYDPEAAADETRYFGVEIDHIRKQLEGNLNPIRRVLCPKHVVPVIFPPTTTKNLPPHLRYRVAVEASANELPDKRNVPNWIHTVITAVVKLRKDEQVRTFTLTMVAMLLLGAIFVFLPSIFTSTPRTPSTAESNPPKPVPVDTTGPWTFSKRTCEALVGEYQLLAEYKYVYMVVEKKEIKIKATSIDGSWTALSCKKNKGQEGSYLLEGKEQTKHRIEVGIKDTNGKEEYVYVADATNKSDSEITINKDGGLANRKILYKLEEKPEITERNLDKQYWKKYGPHIRNQLNEYERLIVERHRNVSGKVLCIPTHGKKDDIDYIASLCSSNPPYIRVMMKVKDGSL